MQKPKVMAFDLDGTLAESKQRLSADMGNLLASLCAVMPVAILSGASFEQFKKQFLNALPSDTRLENVYIFPVNAAQCFVYRQNTWKPQYDHAFTPGEKDTIMLALKDCLQQVGLGEDPPEVWGERIEDREAQISFSPLGQQAPLHAKEAWRAEFEPVRKSLEVKLIQQLPDFSVAEGGLTTIDITRKGINKAYGITRLAELTGVSISDIMYVGDALGDGGNDAVVIPTGVPTHTVFGPEETAKLIETVITQSRSAGVY